MKRFGLALSGGGFRASLYHLGLLRFLRDAGILPQVTHITSVSGGSIIAAHLVLNWDRYNGSPEEFDAVASEFLSFVRLDIRNRITRRFPLNIPFRWPRRLLGLSNRKLTRTGLLERHYEKYLYGDISLFELPEKPQLHILATNVSEGSLCSFNRDGILKVRRQPGGAIRIDEIHAGLATVAMAVTASSAFPGFFPPVELSGADVGVSAGEFGKQAYTDGGVFDNLGVRMFRYLEPQILTSSPLSRDDFFDSEAACEVLLHAANCHEETPIRRVAQVLEEAMGRLSPAHSCAGTSDRGLSPISVIDKVASEELVLAGLWDVLSHHKFQIDPLFAGLKPVEPDAGSLLQATRVGGRLLNSGEQLWLNRHLLEAAFRQATGQACFRRLNSGLDGVLVSDVGKRIEVKSAKAGGIIRTALRATDILMDRVWQLENETFQDTPGFVFAPITDVVELSDDPTAPHPEIQRQLAHIRTDLDRFSDLEISSLARHGYCVGRKICRIHPGLFGADLPDNAPWDPGHNELTAATEASASTSREESAVQPAQAASEARPVHASAGRRNGGVALDRGSTRLPRQPDEPSPTTIQARTLRASAVRRLWSALLDRRDWISYVYVPLLVPILVLLPYFAIEYYQWSGRNYELVQSLSQGSPDLQVMSRLMKGPEKRWRGVAPEVVSSVNNLDLRGYDILQASYIIDLRKWDPDTSAEKDTSFAHIYRTFRILKQSNEANHIFRFRFFWGGPKAEFRFPQQELQGHVQKYCDVVDGKELCKWDIVYDFEKVLPGEIKDIIIESQGPSLFLERGVHSTGLPVEFPAAYSEINLWIFMPQRRQYREWRIVRYKKGKPAMQEVVKPVAQYLKQNNSILAFKLLSIKPDDHYDILWFYK